LVDLLLEDFSSCCLSSVRDDEIKSLDRTDVVVASVDVVVVVVVAIVAVVVVVVFVVVVVVFGC